MNNEVRKSEAIVQELRDLWEAYEARGQVPEPSEVLRFMNLWKDLDDLFIAGACAPREWRVFQTRGLL